MQGEVKWDDLCIERGASPAPIDDEAFREWMASHPIFISSSMDDEMLPARRAARDVVEELGGNFVMWENISPADLGPQSAYLEGVDKSSLFLLLLGGRYGIADESGYSPTHQEANRAKEKGTPRWIFELADLPPRERHGPMTDWVRSLYNEISVGTFANPADLASQLAARLRQEASNQESDWIKLGNLLFPGQLTRTAGEWSSTFTIAATIREPCLRVALAELAGQWPRHSLDRLTFDAQSYAVRNARLLSSTPRGSREEFVLACDLDPQQAQPRPTDLVENGRTYYPADRVGIWARQALFGEAAEEFPPFSLLGSTGPAKGGTLPEILEAYEVRGWEAEGMVRLYTVEELLTKYGGSFGRLQIGGATTRAVPIDLTFTPSAFEPRSVPLAGQVPYAAPP